MCLIFLGGMGVLLGMIVCDVVRILVRMSSFTYGFPPPPANLTSCNLFNKISTW